MDLYARRRVAGILDLLKEFPLMGIPCERYQSEVGRQFTQRHHISIVHLYVSSTVAALKFIVQRRIAFGLRRTSGLRSVCA